MLLPIDIILHPLVAAGSSATLTPRNNSADMSNFNTFENLGSFQIGVDISFVLIGVLFLQAYFYAEHYTNDRIGIKIMVPNLSIVSHGFALNHTHRCGAFCGSILPCNRQHG